MARFTEKGVGNIKPKAKTFLKTEGEGLYLRVTPGGKKTWLHHYKIGSTRKWYTLGEYPAIGLKEAREINGKLSLQTGRGEDPALNLNPTVEEMFIQWSEAAKSPKGKPWSAAHKRNLVYAFRADILPYIGHVKVEDVRKRDIRALLEKVEKRAPNQALQLYRRLKRLFNYAAEKDIIESSPMANLEPIGSQSTKDRHLSFDEIKTFLEALPDTAMAPFTQNALELILRTGQRPSEVLGAHQREIQGQWWVLPSNRTKNGLEHRVPLTEKIIELFGTANKYGLFFPSLTDPKKPTNHNTTSQGLRRAINNGSIPLQPFTPHDLRRSAATVLAEIGFSDEVIGATLNHKKRGVTGEVYSLYKYDAEKRKAIVSLERKIEGILSGGSAGEVVNLATYRS